MLQLHPTLNPLSTSFLLLFLHGLNDDGTSAYKEFSKISNYYLNVKMVFPIAPIRYIDMYNVYGHAWYNIKGRTIFSEEDSEGLKESYHELFNIIEKECIDFDRVIIVGYSQGGAMSLYMANKSPNQFKNIISMSGYLPLSSGYGDKTSQHILMTHGTNDVEVPYVYGLLSKSLLSLYGHDVTFWKFNGDHEMPPGFPEGIFNYLGIPKS